MSQITVGGGHGGEKTQTVKFHFCCILSFSLNVAPVTGENANVRPCRAISGKSICMEA